jgi:hypothetical protein
MVIRHGYDWLNPARIVMRRLEDRRMGVDLKQATAPGDSTQPAIQNRVRSAPALHTADAPCTGHCLKTANSLPFT